MKGSRCGMFKVGDRVKFNTDIGHKVYKKTEEGEVFSHNVRVNLEETGRIVKLHKSGRQGVVEIRPEHALPETGMRKISRRLQHVEKTAEVL